ncbi:MAG: tRNA pseudouridine(38-40) synthase TruA [Eubacterium sp.]|nr:tRNA pseudouridine(38-40) synthase TruA [Eubacterium sp.]
MRILLRVAYDGTSYSGWQCQDNARTIEGALNEALSQLTGEEIRVIGASRTDAGVHSHGNVCVFDTETRIPPDKICYAVNNSLQDDIRVIESREVDADFHPRHCDSVKTYEYKIWNDRFPSPVYRLYSHFTYRILDLAKMKAAALKLEGEHDFGAFCSSGSQVETTVRTVYKIDIIVDTYKDGQITDSYSVSDNGDGQKMTSKYGQMIRIRVTGSGFLYNMVRIIAGTLIDIGNGLMDISDIDKCLESHDRADAGPTAPANGLTMIGIEYKKIC